MTTTMGAMKNKTAIRFRVFDLSDRFVGVWYAASEIAAIRAAITEGYDAWSAIDTDNVVRSEAHGW